MAMLSLAPPKPTNPFFQTQHHHQLQHHRHHHQQKKMKGVRPISATKIPFSPPPPSPPPDLYQPFRPPPSPLPKKYRSLGPVERLDILRDRMGLWHEYAPLIPALANDGFTPPSIEEVTGISGVEQNRLVVGAQVRDSLLSSSFDPNLLAFFDVGGAELLYELRFLNGSQRAAAARCIVEQRFDPRAAQELARAVKDFTRRRGDNGWSCFSAAHPGDCLAYTHFRLSGEALSADDRIAALERAMETAETEGARKRIEEEMKKAAGGEREGIKGGEGAERVTVPVVRLMYGEVAEATSVALLPVCRPGDGAEGVAAAPGWCRVEGDLGVVAADRGWGRWVVLPRWGPVAAVLEGMGVAVEFGDGRVLSWRASKKWGMEEAVLVVADRKRREVTEESGYYLVAEAEKGELGVERGDELLEKGVKEALGAVVLVVRPPKEEEDYQLTDEDWE